MVNEKQESTADRVRLLRSYLRLSQEALGQRVGVSKSTISGIERGAQGIAGVADRLATVLGTTTDYLYGLTDNPLPPDDADNEISLASPLRTAILDELERLDEIDQQILYQMAMTLRLAKERRTPRVIQ